MPPFAPGRRAWVNYGFAEVHERLIGAHVDGSEYVVVSPDYDVFIEQLDTNNLDLESFRIAPPGGGLPVGLPGPGEVLYSFTALTAVQETALLAEARELADQERAARGLVGAARRPPEEQWLLFQSPRPLRQGWLPQLAGPWLLPQLLRT